MRNTFFFQIDVLPDQVALAEQLVDFSLQNHPVTDIFARDPGGQVRQREYRLTGTLGEIVFADVYRLARPVRSFGALDGQDFGQDFALRVADVTYALDVKTMRRRDNRFRTNYVLNLPAYQMQRPSVVTDFYFCVSLHTDGARQVASLLGSVAKRDIESGEVGVLYRAQTRRVKDDGGSFVFQRDTYEVDFADISPPWLSPRIEAMPGFERKILLPAR
jgi:hypothetical protein